MKFHCELIHYTNEIEREVFEADDEEKAVVWLKNRLKMVDRRMGASVVEGRIMVELPVIDGVSRLIIIRKEIVNWREFLVKGK